MTAGLRKSVVLAPFLDDADLGGGDGKAYGEEAHSVGWRVLYIQSLLRKSLVRMEAKRCGSQFMATGSCFVFSVVCCEGGSCRRADGACR